MNAKAIYIVSWTYLFARDLALWTVVMFLLGAPQWAYGVLYALAGVLFLLVTFGASLGQARKRSS